MFTAVLQVAPEKERDEHKEHGGSEKRVIRGGERGGKCTFEAPLVVHFVESCDGLEGVGSLVASGTLGGGHG